MTAGARGHFFLRQLPGGNQMAQRHAEPATLTAHHDCEFREVLDRVGDKWSLLVIAMLEQRPTARARFSELKRSIPGISQRMLTATLRSLERDGLLTRHVYAEVPPRVEYALTPLGKQFMQPVRGLVTWLQTHWSSIRAAREKFDRQSQSRKAS
jgi:DNA-binding HxlR family transcriptional regulator